MLPIISIILNLIKIIICSTNPSVCLEMICSDGLSVSLEHDFLTKFKYFSKVYNEENKIIREKRYKSATIRKFQRIILDNTDISIDFHEFSDILRILHHYKPLNNVKNKIYNNIADTAVSNIFTIMENYNDETSGSNKFKNIGFQFWIIFLKILTQKENCGLEIDKNTVTIHFFGTHYNFTAPCNKINTIYINFYYTIEKNISKYKKFAFVLSQILNNKENLITDLKVDYRNLSMDFIEFINYFQGKFPKITEMTILSGNSDFQDDLNYEINSKYKEDILLQNVIENFIEADKKSVIIDNFVKRFPNLKKIKMDIFYFSPTFIQKQFLKNKFVCERLKGIKILTNRNYDCEVIDLNDLNNLKKLENVYLNIEFEFIITKILNNLKSSGNIKHVIFENLFSISSESVFKISSFKKLRKIEIIWSISSIDNAFLVILGNNLIQQNLKELRFSKFKNFSLQCCCLLEKFTKLKKLEFQKCTFEKSGLSILLQSVNLQKSLKTLIFNDTNGFSISHTNYFLRFKRLKNLLFEESELDDEFVKSLLDIKKSVKNISINYKNKI
ncbi:hypothetical protein DMUE_4957 [Dictyocoela muelleri]|nr:hypothetical protein DMUE_4957 [Dictyocoela muelleri]